MSRHSRGGWGLARIKSGGMQIIKETDGPLVERIQVSFSCRMGGSWVTTRIRGRVVWEMEEARVGNGWGQHRSQHRSQVEVGKNTLSAGKLGDQLPQGESEGRFSFVVGEGLAYYLTVFTFLRTISSRVLILDCYGAVRLSWFLPLAWSIPQSASFRDLAASVCSTSRPGGLNGLRRQLPFSNRELENILHHRTRLPAFLFGGIPSTDAHPRERRIKKD
ncbi:hypothetical protein BJX68DRAFT_55200 [Aspergillus pseudodeflectus]|uniref:Uncharacterized protein n=1 Tax=Aspergillus pseudodeflectus TaxID=176178 RepID=A0ABR4KJZ3_9EURO